MDRLELLVYGIQISPVIELFDISALVMVPAMREITSVDADSLPATVDPSSPPDICISTPVLRLMVLCSSIDVAARLFSKNVLLIIDRLSIDDAAESATGEANVLPNTLLCPAAALYIVSTAVPATFPLNLLFDNMLYAQVAELLFVTAAT
jgi:hypothetical protein